MNEGAGTAIGSGDGRLFVAPSPEELNRVLPNFEVESLIGQGGMGAVYKARQPKLDRYVAIKVVPSSFGKAEHNFADRFEREARAMAGLNHPNIVTVHDFGETENGYLYIVMEYVDGRDMHHAIVSGRAGASEALAWMIQLCDGIQYAHDHDVVHRDIKPANILINSEGQIKVGDFGLVKLVGRKLETAITLSQVAMGTPDYAAPESIEVGGTVDHRADVYSLGVVFYELLTGKVPRGAWKPPSAFVPVNPRLDQIVVKAMQPDPGQRYQSAAQLKEAIVAVQAAGVMNDSVAVRPVAGSRDAATPARGAFKGHELTKRRRKRGAPVAQALLAVVILGLAAGAFVVMENPALQELAMKNVAKLASAGNAPAKTVPPAPAPAAAPAVADRPAAPTEPAPAPDVGDSADVLRLVAVDQGWVDVVPSLQFPRDLVSGRWKIHERALKPLSQKESDRCRLRVPMLLENSYEVALEVMYQNGVVPFVLTLPLRAGPMPVLIGEAGLPNEPPFLVIGSGAAPRGKGEVTRRFPVKLSPSGPHSFSVKVLNRGEEVAILVAVDGVENGRAVGALNEFSPGGKLPEVLSRQLMLGAFGAVEFRDFRVRSLAAKEWLPDPARTVPPKRVIAKATVPAAKDSLPKPKPANEERDKPWIEAVKQRVGEVEAIFGKRELDFARATYDVELASLREKYNAALNRAMQENDSIPVRAAVQRELMRIREGERVEATDPPEMPEAVKKLRMIYRQETSKLDEQLNLALAPMLREHLESLSALETEKTAAGQYPEAAKTLVAEARGRVERRLEQVHAFLAGLEKTRKAEEASAPASAPGTPVPPSPMP